VSTRHEGLTSMAQVIAELDAGKARSFPGEATAIDNILTSHTFERTPMLKRLLVYLWEHRGKEFSEYAIATEALGRRPDFDPKVDATVRVEISRLRQQLNRFYETEKPTSPVRVRIPIGSHYLEMVPADVPAGAPGKPDLARPSPPPALWLRLLVPVAFACLVLLAVDVYLRIETTYTKRIQPPTQADPLPFFWQAFLSNSLPTHIIIPRPTFVVWGSDLVARDTYVNDFSGWKNSSKLAGIGRQLGPPELMQNYAVATDALGALCLASFLQARNLPVTVTTTVDAMGDPLAGGNTIALGTSRTLEGFKRSIDRLDASLGFHLLPGEMCVENRRPAKGEPAQFPFRAESTTRSIWPEVLAVLPGRTPHTHLMILTGRHTEPIANNFASQRAFTLCCKAASV